MTRYQELCQVEVVSINLDELANAPLLGLSEDLRHSSLRWQDEWLLSQGLDTARD